MTSTAEVAYANAMLRALTDRGPRMSNPALRQAVGLEHEVDTYLTAREILLHQGLVALGPGYGGTVRLARAADDGEEHQLGDPRYPDESSLYAPMAGAIEHGWSLRRGAVTVATQTTAYAGKKDTGGAWSRPDITTVELRTFTYVPGRHLDVITFEVKPVGAITVQGVYEALAHRRHAHRSYLLLHVPLKDTFATETDVDRVCAAAREQGIGVILAAEPDDLDSWAEPVVAERVDTDPVNIESFVATQMHNEQQKKIAAAASRSSSVVD